MVLNINKPAGMTSHDVVAIIRKLLKTAQGTGEKLQVDSEEAVCCNKPSDRIKVGHAGTLDPQATGVLIILVGKATNLSSFFLTTDKEYIAEMKLGVKTDTQDAWGKIIQEQEIKTLTIDSIRLKDVLSSFCGEILQIPPMVSAVHYNGQRLYKLARQGKIVERKPRKVTIFELELLEFQNALSILRFRVVCSSGTYIRTLCADIGNALGVGGHLTSLVRTRVGQFCLDKAQTISDLKKGVTK